MPRHGEIADLDSAQRLVFDIGFDLTL